MLCIQFVKSVIADNRKFLSFVLILNPVEFRFSRPRVAPFIFALPDIKKINRAVCAGADSQPLQAFCLQLECRNISVGDNAVFTKCKRKAHADLTAQCRRNNRFRAALLQLIVRVYHRNKSGNKRCSSCRVSDALFNHRFVGRHGDNGGKSSGLVLHLCACACCLNLICTSHS